MAIRVKPIDQVVRKWQTNAGAAGPAYVDGVKNPKRPQGQAAAAAAPAWAAGVQQAITDGRFATNVAAAQDKYTANAIGKGAQRYPGGIQAGAPAFNANIQPYLNVIAGITLPPRMPKGDPFNQTFPGIIDTALRAKKLAGGK